MKFFLTYTAFFATSVILALLLGEYIITRQPNPYKYKHQYMTENAAEVESLIFGSSHSFYGINPQYFESPTFSLANISQNFEYDNILLRAYAPKCVKLKNIILPISYFSFFDKDYEHSDESFLITYYKKYMNINIYPYYSKYNFEFTHFTLYSNKIKSIIKGKQPIECDEKGFGLGYHLERRSDKWKENVKDVIARHTASDDSMLEYHLTHLRSIIEYCNSMNLRIILVTTPTWKGYYQNLNKAQLEKMYSTISVLKKEYNFEYYDFLCDERFGDNDFFDADHLSTDGAEKFSRIINEIL